MTFVGIIAIIFLTILSTAIFGPWGAAIPSVLLFGLVFSIYMKNKQILGELKIIREKLDLLTDDERALAEEERIAKAIGEGKPEAEVLSEINREIEAELEAQSTSEANDPPDREPNATPNKDDFKG